eukprot:921478-Rhodomonas_salina.2
MDDAEEGEFMHYRSISANHPNLEQIFMHVFENFHESAQIAATRPKVDSGNGLKPPKIELEKFVPDRIAARRAQRSSGRIAAGTRG